MWPKEGRDFPKFPVLARVAITKYQTAWLALQKFIFSQFWRKEVQGQGDSWVDVW